MQRYMGSVSKSDDDFSMLSHSTGMEWQNSSNGCQYCVAQKRGRNLAATATGETLSEDFV